MKSSGYVVATATKIGYPQFRGPITTRRIMKKLWSKLFKKNNKTQTPSKKLNKVVENIERDDKGRWITPTTEPARLHKDYLEELDNFKKKITSEPVSQKKPVAKKPATPAAKKPVAKKPTTKKNPPKGK